MMKPVVSRIAVSAVALLSACAVAVPSSARAATSESIPVWVDVGDSLQWKTVMTDRPSVALDWPDGAVKAVLTVTSGRETVSYDTITDTSLDSYVLKLTSPASYSDERVYSLTLEYRDSSDETLSVKSAEIGAVCGVNGAATRCVPKKSESRDWLRYKSSHAVIPIPEGASTLTVDDDDPEAVNGPGWRQLDLNGTHTLALTVDEDEWTATPYLGIVGTVILCF